MKEVMEQASIGDRQTSPSAKKAGIGFFGGGLLAAIVLLAVLIATALPYLNSVPASVMTELIKIADGFAESFLVQLEKFSEEEPRELPAIAIEAAELDSLNARWNAFVNSDNQATNKAMELSDLEVNALIQNHPDWQDLKGEVFIKVNEKDQLEIQFSYSLAKVDKDRFAGRYLNGSGTISFRLVKEKLEVFLVAGELRGEAFSDGTLKKLGGENLSSLALFYQHTAQHLWQLDRIEIRNGKLWLRPRQP